MLPNCPQSVIGYYGTLLAGDCCTNESSLYRKRTQYQLHDSGAKVILCLDLVFPRVTNVQNATRLEHVIVTRIADFTVSEKFTLSICAKSKRILL